MRVHGGACGCVCMRKGTNHWTFGQDDGMHTRGRTKPSRHKGHMCRPVGTLPANSMAGRRGSVPFRRGAHVMVGYKCYGSIQMLLFACHGYGIIRML